MTKDNITNDKHFDAFKKECDKWIKIFGLIGWQVDYEHDGDEKERNLAWCQTNILARRSTIGLVKNWAHQEVTTSEVKRCAFHEVCELLLSRMKIIAETRIIGTDEIAEENHNLIRILENVLWLPTQK
jgi:hypothetical protein